MKIQIKNLGPIAEFEFDLTKDLSIIFGKNNIGKSYAIICLYILIKNLTKKSFLRVPYEYITLYNGGFINEIDGVLFSISDNISTFNKSLAKKFSSPKLDEIEITNDIRNIINNLIESIILPDLQKSFSNSFDSINNLSNKFSGKKFSIILNFDNLKFTISAKDDNLELENLIFKDKYFVKKAKTNRGPTIKDNKFILYYNTKPSAGRGRKAILYHPINRLFSNIQTEISQNINNIYFLPASRSGLYEALSTFSAVIAELSKSRNFLTKRIELPNISEPVSDYFLYLSNISRPQNIKKYTQIATEIENQILEGEVSFNKESRKIVYTPKDVNTQLDLSFTSSMVSEIAPIVAFLKYIISDREHFYPHDEYFYEDPRSRSKASNLIFIEEPEAHLHPEIQVKLMELFVKLTKCNIKLVMTSHSNYMFNKLNNLILDKKIDSKNIICNLLKFGKSGSKVDPKLMKVEDDGILDENFVMTSEKLFEERQNISKNKEKDVIN
ncbi:MAG: AAA family ATPase [Bacteroidales bacterium]|jgi:AAA15 family ATPase/GTPase|nr:AAA family ATPase [Bacteroidales bacterium]